ncbi:MAG: hypothetical protein HXX80_06260 [Nitrososphaerales archaeon]|nr:hypothetical protein [Nitrososphaerales archaeon]
MSEEREHKIVVRDGKIAVGERDYRAFLALTLVGGLIALLWKGDYQAASVLGPLAGSAVAWYFSRKEKKG